MARVECAFCGLPFVVRAPKEGVSYYCCSGCALASRIPMDGESFPVSRGLLVALGLGFGLFNQILFAVLGGAVLAEGRADVGQLALRISMGIGGVLLVGGVAVMLTARSRGWTDGVLAFVTLAGGLWGGGQFFLAENLAGLWMVVGANMVVGAWLARGWLRRFLGRRRRG